MKTRLALTFAVAAFLLAGLQVVSDGHASGRIPSAVWSTHADDASTVLAATPPMGWNSWDGYGTTITEAQVKANADWFASHLKSSGWEFIVVDMEWFVTYPTAAGNSKESVFNMDPFGRYTPSPNRFPSSADGAGFKPLADYLHSLGLKFGIHILSGIPKQAVDKNLPIAGSSFHAKDAANTSESCPWNADNYGAAPGPAAQAYFDSIAALYASWGVDFLKVDCIASRPYRGEDIRMIGEALAKTGRPITLSLSPGAAPIDKAGEMRKYAQMWRISDDIWDLWHSDVAFPQGVGDQFANVAKWALMGQPGHWPDADMLPLGYLGPHPGWGEARATRLTHDEQRTLMTLWCMFPSPLMVGGDLTQADAWTTSLLTNQEVIAVDQHSTGNHPVIATDQTVAWVATSNPPGQYFVAVFNLQDAKRRVKYSWSDLGLGDAKYAVRDVWEQRDIGAATDFHATLGPHASVLYRLRTAPEPK